MNKKILLVVSISVLLFGCASGPKPNEEDLKFESVIDFQGKSSAALYDYINAWAVEAFVDSKEAIDFSSAETGTVRGKAVFEIELEGVYVGFNPPLYAYCVFSFEARAGRVRFSFDLNEVSMENAYGFEQFREVTQKDIDSFDYDAACQKIVDDFVAFVEEHSSDW